MTGTKHPIAGVVVSAMLLMATALLPACSGGDAVPVPDDDGAPASVEIGMLRRGLLVALAVLESDEDGRPLPQPARLGMLTRDDTGWAWNELEDPDSNVFHKVMVFEPTPGDGGILTLGGMGAFVKLWRGVEDPEILWTADFGGQFSRMRDAEIGDLYGDGSQAIAVATHDQGVVAVVRADANGGWQVQELDSEPETFVHEIEIGDLDADGILEVYATPSARNTLDGEPQPGFVSRYVPATGEGRTVVADLGDRHAKEILVDDVDGDGTDELYVVVEAVSGGRVEILRYDADTAADAGVRVASIDDRLCRFLTAGDVDGDGVKEMVAAANKSGVWLLRPGAAGERWDVSRIDSESGGFEHAAILTDLDGDGADELYVASDDHAEIRRYVWHDGEPVRELLYSHPGGLRGFTWNLMPAPVELMPR